jgi:membrane-associated phospholipid phosphatase
MNFLKDINNLVFYNFLNLRSDFGIDFFSVLTFLGDWKFLLPLTFIIVFILFFKRKRKFIFPFLFVFLVSGAVALIAKEYFNVSRPSLSAIEESGPSFPSGHAVLSFSFYSYLAFILINIFKKKYFYLIFFVAVFIIFLVGFSRLYLGVHYLTDILAGYLLSIIFLIFGIFIYKKTKNYPKK